MGKTYAIYEIEHLPSGLRYVGQTYINPKIRINHHFARLRCKKHCSRHFQDVWDLFPDRKFFVFRIIEEAHRGNVYSRENYWINHYKQQKLLLNQMIDGNGAIYRKRHGRIPKAKLINEFNGGKK